MSDDPWLYFSAEQIARTIGCPQENVETHWPNIVYALNELEESDRAVQLGALATIGVEAGSFRPIEEFRNLDGSEPSYWANYSGGARFHGRGFVQLTHDYNYRTYGSRTHIQLDLVSNPDRALEPSVAAWLLAYYFRDHAIERPGSLDPVNVANLCREGDWEGVRLGVNGGLNGWDRFYSLVLGFDAIVKVEDPVIPVPPDPPRPTFEDLQASIIELQKSNHVLRDNLVVAREALKQVAKMIGEVSQSLDLTP